MTALLPNEDVGAYSAAGPYVLAILTHKAEDAGDDVTFLALQSEVERRSHAEQEAYRLAYIDAHRHIIAARKAPKE